MGSFTSSGKDDILTDLKNAHTFYVALLVEGTEVSTGSYARVAATFAAPSGGTMVNTGEITFPTATADWGTITEIALYTASSGGTKKATHTISTAVSSTFVGYIASGELSVVLT